MRVVAEAFEELAEILVNVGMPRHVVYELIVFFLRRQLALPQQPRYFEKARLLGQLFDRVATVTENALVAIDVSNRATTSSSVEEGRIVAHETRVVRVIRLDLLELGGANSALDDWNRVALVVAVVFYIEGGSVRRWRASRFRRAFGCCCSASIGGRLLFGGRCCGRTSLRHLVLQVIHQI